MKAIEFSFTIEETNKIMEALGQMPFVQVHHLITKIHEGANAQLMSTNPTLENENVKNLANG